LSASAEQSSQAVSKSDQGTSFGVGAEPLSVETKPRGRKELPAVIAFPLYNNLFCRTFLLQATQQSLYQFQVGKMVLLMAWDSTYSIILMHWYIKNQDNQLE
jgi:hypothetical protein